MSRAGLFDILTAPELAMILRDAPPRWQLPRGTFNRENRLIEAQVLLAHGGIPDAVRAECAVEKPDEQIRVDKLREQRARALVASGVPYRARKRKQIQRAARRAA